jgi:hypothetical protein
VGLVFWIGDDLVKIARKCFLKKQKGKKFSSTDIQQKGKESRELLPLKFR